MIEKSRLEELIEQGATIYGKIFGEILTIELSEKNKPEIKYDDRLDVYCSSDEWRNKMQFCYLWETKEEAEWELEFGNITRTETLRLPTWKEFLKDNFGIRFYYKSREFCLHKVRYSADDNNPQWKINIYEDYCDDYDTVAWEKEWDLTKENYIEACRLAKKLFLGEVKE